MACWSSLFSNPPVPLLVSGERWIAWRSRRWFRQRQFKPAFGAFGCPFHAAIGPQFHPRRFGGAQQTINDRLRRIACGKHAAISLGFQLHPAGFKPRHRVARRENLEWRQQRPFATRKPGGQLTRIEAGVRDIATAAAGDADFGKELRPALHYRHLGIWSAFGASNGRKKSGRSTAHDNDPPRTHSRENSQGLPQS